MPADDDVTLGEVRRTLDRLDRRVAEGQKHTDDRLAQLAGQMVPTALWAAEHKALEDTVSELRADTKAGFERVENTSQERKRALEKADAENAAATAAVRKMVEDDRAARDARRPSTLTNWLTGIGVTVALIALIVTLLTHGGH